MLTFSLNFLNSVFVQFKKKENIGNYFKRSAGCKHLIVVNL